MFKNEDYHKARLIWITPDAEKLIAYCARVSNPANQENEDISKLLRYCAKNGHWSIFEMASACIEITTSRTIARQILRHRSFSFQEFSQRYAAVTDFVRAEPRRQDEKNRQNSTDDLGVLIQEWFLQAQEELLYHSQSIYEEALKQGVAKECARAVLPEGLSQSKMYMVGSIRSWIHYLNVRCGNGTQVEHQVIANAIKAILKEQLPVIGDAIGW
jgi:thymidylate synthase (FAD)